jgi:cholesterol oxidase
MNRIAPRPIPPRPIPPGVALAPAEPDRIWFSERAALGLRFTERMTGFFFPSHRVGAPDTERIECTLTVLVDDLERMMNGWAHEARLIGTLIAPSLAKGPLTVTRGRFSLFQVVPDRVDTRRIRYRMKATSEQGAVYYICGFKELRNSFLHHAWFDFTTLAFAILDGRRGRPGRIVGLGVMKISAGDFLRELTTIRARGAQSLGERVDAPARFMSFFAGMVATLYARALAPSLVTTPGAPPPQAIRRRRLVDPDSAIVVTTPDGIPVRLTRYRGGPMGPVMLVPGFTTVASSFDTPTVDKNLVQFLCEHGWDVWLFDYRASPAFPPAWTAFTIDDIARRDYPAGVQEVLSRTGAAQVQIVAHCVGSISLFMSLLDGRLDGLVRSVVSSQVAAHIVAAKATEVKSGAFLAAVIRRFGVQQISASFDARRWGDWLTDQVLKLYPTHERCNNPVCRRLLFIFHEIYRHEQLNSETHDAVYEWFGTSSMDALQHLSLIVRTGHIVDAEGQDVYLRHLDRLRLPISFMHGALNRVFPPEATRLTFDALCNAFGARRYRRKEFEGYNHMDCFIGRTAWRDVYPWILEQLENPPGR